MFKSVLPFFLLIPLVFAADGEEEVGRNDFHIYDLMEKTRLRFPDSSHLYDLFGLSWNADPESISTAFRKASIKHHPDKRHKSPNPKESQEIYGLMTSVAELLRSPEGRKRYAWLVNEAPPWHRSTVYAKRTLRKFTTAKYTLRESLLLLAGLILLGDYLMLLLFWCFKLVGRWESRRQIRELGVKEVKRMRRKVERANSPLFMNQFDTNYEALHRAQESLPPFPLPWHTLPFRLVSSLTGYFMAPREHAE